MGRRCRTCRCCPWRHGGRWRHSSWSGRESIDVVLDHGLFDSVGECRHLLVDNQLGFVALKLAGALHVRLVAFDSSRIDRSIRVSQGFALVYQLLNCLGLASSVVAHVGFIVGDEFGVTTGPMMLLHKPV